jgi:hypothetical protein
LIIRKLYVLIQWNENTGFKIEMTRFLYLNVDQNIETNLSKHMMQKKQQYC